MGFRAQPNKYLGVLKTKGNHKVPFIELEIMNANESGNVIKRAKPLGKVLRIGLVTCQAKRLFVTRMLCRKSTMDDIAVTHINHVVSATSNQISPVSRPIINP